MVGLDSVSGFVPSMPKVSIGGKTLLIIVCVVVLLCVIVWGIWELYKKLQYKEKLVLFRKISGKIIPVLKDTGRIVRLGKAGDYWMIWNKCKRVSSKPTKRINKNTSWWYETEDGGIINFELTDFDSKMREAGYKPLAEDMRLIRIAIERNLAKEFNSESWLSKYGNLLGLGFLCIIIIICALVIMSKMGGLIDVSSNNLATIENLHVGSMEKMEKIATVLENIFIRVSSGGIPVSKVAGG